VLAEAAGPEVREAIVGLCSAADDDVTGAVAAAALRSREPELARAAAELLVGIADSATALRVLRQCFESADAAVRGRGVEALEGMSAPEVVDFLPAALTDDSELVRRAGASTLSLIAGTAHHPLWGPLLEQLADPASALGRAVVANPDNQVRRQAVQSLGFVRSDAVMPVLEQMARDEDDEVRQEVVVCLAGAGTERAVRLMSHMLHDPVYRVSSSALDMLAGRLGAGSAAFLECLKEALAHPAAELRRHAVLMLDRYDAEQAAPLLEAASGDRDFEVARRAGEMLRRLQRGTGMDWLAGEMDRQTAGQRALAVWEAGMIGSEAGMRIGSGAALDGGRIVRQIVPILERALREGAASDRLHAINELAGLVDVADSRAMQQALRDSDASVRSRAADMLQYTRDAGLLAQVIRSHPDARARRRAVESLADNPAGPKGQAPSRGRVSFTSTRTLGMELFGHLLAALDDADDSVRQAACEAVREYGQSAGVLPVRAARRALLRLAEDEGVSVLIQEQASLAEEAVRRVAAGQLIARDVGEVLAWRGQVAREAHALYWDADAGGFRVRPAAGAEAVERWAEAYSLSPDQVAAVRRAADGQAALDKETARALLRGLTRELTAALNAVAYAATALRLIGQEEWLEEAERWTAAVETGPKLQWAPNRRGARYAALVTRLRKRAWLHLLWAREALGGAAGDGISEAMADPDDWVKLAALRAAVDLHPDRADLLDHLRELAARHAADRDYCEPVGLASVPLLLSDGTAGAVRLAAGALGAARVDFRMELTQQLMVAAQRPAVAAAIEDYLVERPVDSLPSVCLALALRGAGNTLAAVNVPPAAGREGESEVVRARLALRAMQDDDDAARELSRMVRQGTPRERYQSTSYLALARVHSAALLFASMRDQQDAPYMLRGLCAASLVRRGHPAAMGGWQKLLKGLSGRIKADMLTHLCRAVEDTIPLMLECADVNVGRFV